MLYFQEKIYSLKEPIRVSGKIYYNNNIFFLIYENCFHKFIGEISNFENNLKSSLLNYIHSFSKLENNLSFENAITFLKSIDNPKIEFGFDQIISNIFGINYNNVLINGFIPFLNKKQLSEKIIFYKNNNINTIKVKLGRNNFSEDIEIIEFIIKLFPDVILKFDVNGAWNFEDAKKNIENLIKYNFDYIEDPVANIDYLIKLENLFPKKIAVDEYIRDRKNFEEIIISDLFNVIVAKPSNIGGFFYFNELRKKVKNKRVIISSMYESNIGVKHLINIASLFGNETHGLSTINLYKEEEYLDLKIENNFIKVI